MCESNLPTKMHGASVCACARVCVYVRVCRGVCAQMHVYLPVCMEDAGAACPGHALVTITDAAGEPQGGCGSAPRQPSEAARGKGTQFTQGPGGERRKPGAQGLFLGGRMLAVDPRGCSSGRVSWSSKARRAGLTPALPLLCGPQSCGHPLSALHTPLATQGQGGRRAPHTAVGAGARAASKEQIVCRGWHGWYRPPVCPPVPWGPTGEHDSIQALGSCAGPHGPTSAVRT